jgi:hypothetical protein
MSETQTHRRPYWHGFLCEETNQEILERMTEMLTDQWFTTVTCNSFDEHSTTFSVIDVYTSRRLSAAPKLTTTGPGISWGTQGYSMSVHTDAKTQSEGRTGHKLNYVMFTFGPRQIVIDHYAIAGYALRWILAIEDHKTYD